MSASSLPRSQPGAGPRHYLRCLATAAVFPFLSGYSLAVTYNETCYWPDGRTAWGYSCNLGVRYSGCCSEGWACLANGLCMDPNNPGRLHRYSCTDKSWNSPDCPRYCIDSDEDDDITSWESLRQCSISSRDKWYCRSRNMTNQCDNNPLEFTDPNLHLETIITVPTPTESSAAPTATCQLPSTSVTPNSITPNSDPGELMVPQRTVTTAAVGGVFGGLIAGALGAWLLSRLIRHRQHKPGDTADNASMPIDNINDKNAGGNDHFQFNSGRSELATIGDGNSDGHVSSIPTSGQMYHPPTELYPPPAGSYHPTHSPTMGMTVANSENTGFMHSYRHSGSNGVTVENR